MLEKKPEVGTRVIWKGYASADPVPGTVISYEQALKIRNDISSNLDRDAIIIHLDRQPIDRRDIDPSYLLVFPPWTYRELFLLEEENCGTKDHISTINNDNRDTCFKCGHRTKKEIWFTKEYSICPVCNI